MRMIGAYMSNIKVVLILAAVSLSIGVFVFTSSRYKSASLVIDTRTLEKGTRSITVVDKGNNKLSSIKFYIGSDDGDYSFYSLELPRIRLESVSIPPLASAGKYEINRILLSNNDVSYIWNKNMQCQQKYYENGIATNKACDSASPTIYMDENASLHIASIPDHGFENTFWFRFFLALCSTIVVFSAGIYLLKPVAEAGARNHLMHFSVKGAWLLVGSLYFYQFFLLWKYSVDIPFWEEWEFFEPFALPSGLTLHWLFHHLGSNQQIMVFTKLVAWLDYWLFNLDFVKIKLFNYLLFGGLLYAVIRFKIDLFGRGRFRVFPFFLLFLVSPIINEIHTASFLSGQAFMLLFFFGMLHFAINNEPSKRNAVITSILSLLAIYSLAAGMVIAMVTLICLTIFLGAKISSKQIDRPMGIQNILICWGIVLPGILLWFIGFNKPEGSQKWLLPLEPKYWGKFFNLLGFGFGFETENPLPGFACFMILMAPLAILLHRKAMRWQPETWKLIAAIFGIMAVLGQIAMGRGNMPYSIIISRYALFAFLLIPFSAMAWWLAMEHGSRKACILTTLFCICFAAYLNNWDFTIYRDIRQLSLMDLECVERYVNGSGDGTCPTTHSRPIGTFYDSAKKLDVHFTRQFEPNSDGIR